MAGAAARFDYISDGGATYYIVQDASNAAAVGNTAATVSVRYNQHYRGRYITAQHPTTGRERKIIIGNPANAMWVGGTNVVTLPDFDDLMSPTVYAVRGRFGEKRPG